MGRTQRILAIAIAVVGGIGFTSQVAEDSATALSTPGDDIDPVFRISKLRNEVRLQGHTVSLSQEHQLVLEAEFAFPGYAISADFEPLGLVPPHWEESTIQSLHALTAADSGTAELTRDQLSLKVVTSDELSWASSLRSLASALPGDIDIVDDSISIKPRGIGTLCRDATDDFALGPINFEEATSRFRPSAYPRLEQLAALADACRETIVRVTGHSDSTGEEEWNRTLSLLRAKAVAGYLVEKGIAPDRLQVHGAGSAEPVADNNNRYGRSLNRRIEIEIVTD